MRVVLDTNILISACWKPGGLEDQVVELGLVGHFTMPVSPALWAEYIEVFARSLKETMESAEGVSYLLHAVGFEVPPEQVNLRPELRWKRPPGA